VRSSAGWSSALAAISTGSNAASTASSRGASSAREAEVHTSVVMDEPLTLAAVFTPDENGWTMAQLAEWPAVVTCGRTVDEARAMLLDAAREMLASYREEGREPPIGTGHVEPITIVDTAA